MSKKMMLLALAAVSAAIMALPAMASAGGWDIHPENVAFKISGPIGTLTASNGNTVTCEKTTGSGKYVGATAGTMSLIFTGCKSSGTTCTGNEPGEPAGQIQTKAAFNNVYLDKTGVHKTPGVTIEPTTGTSGTFTSFKCAFGLVSITVTGTVNGEVESGCQTSTTATNSIEFASGPNHGEVKWPYVTEDSTTTKDDLTVHRNGEALTGSMDATATLTFEGATAGVTCT